MAQLKTRWSSDNFDISYAHVIIDIHDVMIISEIGELELWASYLVIKVLIRKKSQNGPIAS